MDAGRNARWRGACRGPWSASAQLQRAACQLPAARALILAPAALALALALALTLATSQANSSQSEASLEAYHKALETRPNYVRAWINVGMSFVNQGKYEVSSAQVRKGEAGDRRRRSPVETIHSHRLSIGLV